MLNHYHMHFLNLCEYHFPSRKKSRKVTDRNISCNRILGLYDLHIGAIFTRFNTEDAMFAHIKLDSYDKALLRLLQEDATQSQKDLAERIHLSPAAVQRRIVKLQKSGAIKKISAIVEPTAVGLPVTVIIEVTLRDERSTTVAAAKKMFKNAEDVQQCYGVAGSAGIILIMSVPSTEEYEAQTARLLSENPLVMSYRTIIVLDRVKSDLSLPL